MVLKVYMRAKEGDREAEDRPFAYLVDKFLTITCYRVRDTELAKDIALEACHTIIKKYKSENIKTSFEAWAHGILNIHIRHRLSSEMKQKARMTRHEFQLNKEINVDASQDFKVRLRQCFKRLIEKNIRYARVVNLAYQGFRSNEICKKLSISRTNYYALLSRARESLWNCLSGDNEWRHE